MAAQDSSYALASSFDRRTTVDSDDIADDTEAEVTLVGDPWGRSGERAVVREDAGGKSKKKPDVRGELLARRTASGVVSVASVKRAAAQAASASAPVPVATPPKVPRPTAAAPTFATAPTVPDASPISSPPPSRSVARPPALPTKSSAVPSSAPPPPSAIFEPPCAPPPTAATESATLPPAAIAEPPSAAVESAPPPTPIVAPSPLVFTPIDPWGATAPTNDVDVGYEEALRGMSRGSLTRIALTALVFVALVATSPFTLLLQFLASQWKRASAIVEKRRRPAGPAED